MLPGYPCYPLKNTTCARGWGRWLNVAKLLRREGEKKGHMMRPLDSFWLALFALVLSLVLIGISIGDDGITEQVHLGRFGITRQPFGYL